MNATAALGLNERQPEKGEYAARFVRALVGARQSGMSPAQYARNVLKSSASFCRAMSASLEANGGSFVPEVWAGDIIELLRARAVVRSAHPVVVLLESGNLTMPRITSGSNVGYVGENRDTVSGDIGTGDVKLSAKKLAAIVPASNDLFRFSSYQTDQVIRDDMVAALAVAEDVAFLRNQGTQFSPKGLRYWAQSANIIPATSGQTQAGIIADTNKLLNALQGNNVRMLRPFWFMSYRTFNMLNSAVNGNGAFIWRDELTLGKFRGYPYKLTNNIPNNLSTGVGSESELYLADMADVVIGEVQGLRIDTSQEATYTADGTNLISAFSRDQTIIRIIAEHDLALRHDASVAVLTQVTWQ